MPRPRSSISTIASLSAGAKKLGHPQWESNFSLDRNSSAPHARHLYTPSVLASVYSPVQGASVPASRSTRYSSGPSFSRHSASVRSTLSMRPRLPRAQMTLPSTVTDRGGPMQWLNEPSSWQRTGDEITVNVDPGTDFWRETGYGYIRDSGHVYGEVLAGDLDVSVRIRGVLTAQYDQAGVMLRADEQTWLKTGIEFFEGRARLSTVLTLGRSSWMVTDLPAGSDDILLRVSRRGDAVEVRYLVGEGRAELAALVYMPPDAQVLAGVMAAAPEGPGFRISFHDLHVTERDWSAEAGDDVAAGDWAGENAWAGDGGGGAWPLDEGPLGEAGADAWSGENGAPSSERSSWEGQEPEPAWDSGQPESGQPESGRPEGDRPGWASGAASGDHPSWPSGTTPLVNEADWLASIPEEDDPDWPKKLAMEDDPDWPKKLAMEDDPSWATEIGAAEPAAAEPKDGGPSGASGTGAAEPKDSDPSRVSGTGAAEPKDSDSSWAFG